MKHSFEVTTYSKARQSRETNYFMTWAEVLAHLLVGGPDFDQVTIVPI